MSLPLHKIGMLSHKNEILIMRNNPYKPTTKNENMGIRSQLRNGSIKASKKKFKTHYKKKKSIKHTIKSTQKTMQGGRAFIQLEDCDVCKKTYWKSLGRSVRIPKRAHHKLCPRNRKTRGISSAAVMFEKAYKRNIEINNAPINSPLGIMLSRKNGSTITSFYNNMQPNFQPSSAIAYPSRECNPPRNSTKESVNEVTNNNNVFSAATLRQVVDNTMMMNPKQDAIKKFPYQIQILVDYILEQISFKKAVKTSDPIPSHDTATQQLQNYNNLFRPGEIVFKFPKDITNKQPSP